MEKQLRASFPNPGDEEKIRQMLLDDLTTNSLGMRVRQQGDKVYFGYPTTIIVGHKVES